MILERLRVESLGCFREPVEITFTHGLNIISGNNETGKSTLITALHHALFTPYGSQAKDVRELQPWGTELAPEVEVDLSIEGASYRIKKRFLYEPRCVLAEYRDGDYRKIADGDRADERMRSLLLAEKPNGAAGPAHRGLARLLWLPQDEDLPMDIDGVLRTKVESCLGVATLDEVENEIAARIEERNSSFWTKTGRFTKASGLPELENEATRLTQRCSDLEKTIRQMEQHSRDLEQVQEQAEVLSREQASVQQQREAQADAVKRVTELKHSLEKAREQLQARQNALALTDDRRRRFRQALESVEKAKARLAIVEKQLADDDKNKGQLVKQRSSLSDSLEKVRTSIQELDLEIACARELNRAKDNQDLLRGMEKRLASLETLSIEIVSRKKTLVQMPSPSQKDVKNAQQWERNIERLTGRLEAVGLSLSFKAYAQQAGTIARDDDGQDTFTISEGESIAFKAIRKASLTLDGVGELEIHSGAEEAANLQDELGQEQAKLQDLLAPFAAQASADLERLRQEKIQAQKELDGLIEQLGNELGDAENLDDIRASVARLERELDSACADLEVDTAGLEQLDRIDLGELEQQAQAMRDQEGALREQQESNNSALEAARDIKQSHANAKIQLEAEIVGAQKIIAELISTAGSEQAIETAYQEARRERDAAQEKERELADSLPEAKDDPGVLVERLTAKLKEILDDMKELEHKEIKLKGDIDRIAEQGTHAELVRCEEHLEQSRREYERLFREAKVIRLLNELVKTRRSAMMAELTEPISRRVTNYFERISGLVERRVAFGETLRPSSLSTLDSEDISPDLLSTGAREQLHVLTRLALARYLAENEGRMLFVIDDRLVNTDQIRHQRLVELLEEANSELQIVILTCHYQRYRGMKDATYHAMA